MSLSILSEEVEEEELISTEHNQIQKSSEIESFNDQSSELLQMNVSTYSNNFSNEHDQKKGLNNNDQDIELTEQTNTLSNVNQTTKSIIVKFHSPQQSIRENDNLSNEQYEELSYPNQMENLFQQHSVVHDDLTTTRSSETSEVITLATAVSLKDLLCYQDVMNAIEREFHLHSGQEREIIMKLWLKGQTMISILQRFRYLLQDLNIDDKDFMKALKQIRDMVNYANRDVQYLRDHTTMLENRNHFLEHEFQRQLDRVVQEKNEQISRLIHIIDQTCSPPTEYQDHINEKKHSTGTEELLKKFMQQNVELQREIETLRAKLEYTFTLVNEKFDQQKTTGSSIPIIQTAFEQIRDTEMKLQELKLKLSSQQEENDLLKYLIDKSERTSDIEQRQLYRTIEQRSIEREIDRVRRELEMTEKRTVQLEQRFENADETVKFHMEKLKLNCDVLRKHIVTCTQRLDEITKQNLIDLQNENHIQKNKKQQEESNNERKIIQLDNELLKLTEHSNILKSELNNLRKQLQEKEKLELSSTSDLEKERHHVHQLENELKSLRTKYDDVCERVSAATHQLERVKVVLEETTHRCEQLEKEKSEINIQSENLSQNVANITTKYKNKLNTIKSRLEQTERERREAYNRSEQLQNEIERLKNELIYKKEMIFEKDKIIQEAQYKNREILLDRQLVEDRISNECKRLNELVDKNHFLEEELDRMKRNQISETIILRRTEDELSTNDSSKHLEELRVKIDEFEKRFAEETVNKESLQIQIKILEEENIDLRDIMNQMRKRAQDGRKDERDRNDEIQQLIARAEFNVRHYMTNLNLTTLPPSSTLVRIVPLSSSTTIS